jgi:HEAT repeat protein
MKLLSSILLAASLVGALPHRAVVAQGQEPAAAATFREARDLVNAGEWGRAEDRLQHFVAEFAKDREIPAALYWLAFVLKQQGKFPAADEVLTRLIAQHARSPWSADARALRVEIAPRLKNTQVIEQAVTDANEEIRLAALQSLFEARREAAVPIATRLVKDTSASRVMREGALELLADAEAVEAVPVLVEVARADPDPRLRAEAIEALSEFPNAPTLLLELIRSDAPADVRAEAIDALGGIEERLAAADIQSLAGIYDSATDERMKREIIEVFGESRETAALKKLMQIAAGDPSVRLRKAALSALGDSEHPEAARFLEAILK